MKQLDLFPDDVEPDDPDAARKSTQKHEQNRPQVIVQENEDDERNELGRF